MFIPGVATSRRVLVLWAFALVSSFVSVEPAVAAVTAAGDLDTTFDGDGTAVTAIYGDDGGAAVAVQSDGKIVVAGAVGLGPSSDFAVVRYNTDGSLDTGFGGGGTGLVTTDFGSIDRAYAVAIQTDGKIVAAGSAVGPITNLDFALARYTTAGVLDTTFGSFGKVTTDFGVGLGREEAFGLAIQSNGRIVAVGSVSGNFGVDFGLARYTAAGVLDTSFSGDGKQVTDFGSGGDEAHDVAIQSNGKLVVAGVADGGPNDDFAVARYLTGGALDSTYGTGGKVTTDFGVGDDAGSGIALQSDGTAVVTGSALGTNDDFAVARYTTAGVLDTSFSTDGKQTTGFGFGDDRAADVRIQSDGKILAAGFATGTVNLDFALARYNTGGGLDSTFGTGGKRTDGFGFGDDQIAGLTLQSDGKSVAAGVAPSSRSDDDVAVARHNTDGSLDSSFSGNGKQTTDVAEPADVAFDVAVQADGKLVAAGSTLADETLVLAVARYNTDGSLDPTFDEDGKVTADFGTTGDSYAYAVAVQPDGKILVGGVAQLDSGYDFGLMRFNTDGSLDASFDGDGKVTTDFGGTHDQARDVALYTDGRIAVAGETDVGFTRDFAVARYTSSGALDTSFSSDGKVTTDFAGADDHGWAVAVQPNGKILAVGYGYTGTGTEDDFALARYNVSGTMDLTFGVGGRQTTDFGSGMTDQAWDVALQSNGRILAAGHKYNGTDDDFALARYTSSGALDATFSGDGLQTTGFGFGRDDGTGLAVQSDGKIVLGGWARNAAGDEDLAMARYVPGGALDTTFSGDGKVTTDLAGDDDASWGLLIQGDGKIVLAGLTGDLEGTFLLARYLAA